MTNLTTLIAPALPNHPNGIDFVKYYGKFYIHLYTDELWFQYFKYFRTEAEAINAVKVLHTMLTINPDYWEEF